MDVRVSPQTTLGKWAAGLIVLWPLLTILGSVLADGLYKGVEAGDGLIDDLRVRPVLAVAMLTGIAAGLASLALNVVAMLKKGERSVLSIVALLIGLFLLVLLVGELFIQH